MSNILVKEMKLSASILSYLFIAFGLMFFLPGYPVLCGAFFVTLGIYQSFQNSREANDLVFSALLPVAKHDVVKGKLVFSCFIELLSVTVMAVATVLRMTVFSASPVYSSNALMNANPFALGVALLIFGLFNLIFVCGFFKTAYKLGKPFVTYIIICFVVIAIAESLHYFPGLGALNAFGFEHIALQLIALCAGIASYILLTLLSYKRACAHFEKIDL